MHGIFLGNGALHLGNHCLGVCHDGEIITATILEYVALNVVVTFVGIVIQTFQVKFCKVNVDEQPNLASMFGIDSIPTLAVVQDRHTLTGMVGVHDKADIKEMLEKCKE